MFPILLLLTLLFISPISADDLVDIGGRKMYLKCQGSGSPTVVFISGRTDRADIWHAVSKEAAKFTHVCSYDRPGTISVIGQNVEASRSTSVPQPVTPKKGVEDLHALLLAAKIQGPYVLVAHSYGGLIARLYASLYPKEVVGLVLVDTLTEFLYDALKPEQQALWIRLNSNYSPDIDRYTVQEKTDFVNSFNEMHNTLALHPMPAVILTSDQPYDFHDLMAKGILPSDTPLDFGPIVFQAHLTGQKRLAKLLHAKQISKTHAGHYIHTEQPQLVIDSIREVVDQIRKNSPQGNHVRLDTKSPSQSK